MGLTRLQPGSCCGCAPSSCNTTFTLVDSCCSVSCNLSGATFTVKSGGTTVATGTTGAGGSVTLDLGTAGTYDVTVSYGGSTLTQSGVALACSSYTYYYAGLHVIGCNLLGVPGATVAVNPPAGITVSPTSVTSDGTGLARGFCYPTPSLPYTITQSRFLSTSGTTTACDNVSLTAATGYHCAPCCAWPVCDTLSLTDSVLGATTLTYDAAVGYWWGTLDFSFGGYCGCPASDTTVAYIWPASGNCNMIGVDHPTQTGAGNICTTGFLSCPAAGTPSHTTWQGTAAGTAGCNPLSLSATANGCGTCVSCFGGAPQQCQNGFSHIGGNSYSTLWGSVGLAGITVTVSDSC